MTFNAGGYEATSTNPERTNWSIKSHDGKDSFNLEGLKIGLVANKLMKMTTEAFLDNNP